VFDGKYMPRVSQKCMNILDNVAQLQFHLGEYPYLDDHSSD